MVLLSKLFVFNVRGKLATRVEKSGHSLCLTQKAAYWQIFCQTNYVALLRRARRSARRRARRSVSLGFS